jgi:beta-lactamase class D
MPSSLVSVWSALVGYDLDLLPTKVKVLMWSRKVFSFGEDLL